MAKTASIYTRVEPEIKNRAEEVLSRLGIPMANAINMFLKQVILREGIPFEITLPQSTVLDYSKLSTEEFNAAVQQGLDDIEAGRTFSEQEVRAIMEARFNE